MCTPKWFELVIPRLADQSQDLPGYIVSYRDGRAQSLLGYLHITVWPNRGAKESERGSE